ncbi:MAG: HlyD family efflux transporter periplasmic adaptor subunit [Candidatus Doudnabacteria bacterium]|nr:HlyD family efflux transporter periplasmic adaptor subunit [Candidatus Doudnabacteria bacterium]
MSNTLKQTEEKIETAAKEAVEKIEVAEKKLIHNPWVRSAAAIIVVAAVVAGGLYWQESSTRVSIDKSQISAPLIALSPSKAGQLNQIYVNEGDSIKSNAAVAQVGDELIKSKTSGVVVEVKNNIGKNINPGETVVNIIDPKETRVVGTIEENKGLDKLKVGQLASFTVDAFGSKTYEGVVDEISPTSKASGVVFNISDKRATQEFEIKVRFNQDKYPELKNGMSAKLTIYIK